MPIAKRNLNIVMTAVRLAQKHPSKIVTSAQLVTVTGYKRASSVLSHRAWEHGLMPIKRGVYGLKHYYCKVCKGFCPSGVIHSATANGVCNEDACNISPDEPARKKTEATIDFDHIVGDWVVRIHTHHRGFVDVYGGFSRYSAIIYCKQHDYKILNAKKHNEYLDEIRAPIAV